MSFRTRLTSFFVVIVIAPMLAIGVLVFRLIGDSEQGKADARAAGLNAVATSVYDAAQARSQSLAAVLAHEVQLSKAAASGRDGAAQKRLAQLAAQAGLVRVILTIGTGTPPLVDVSNGVGAIAPGAAYVPPSNGRPAATIEVSQLTADDYARQLTTRNPGVGVVVRQGPRTLASTLPAASAHRLPGPGTVRLGGTDYRAVTTLHRGIGAKPVHVTVLLNLTRTESSVQTSQLLAAIFIAGFVLLAFAFSVLASRALQGQLGRFLEAARRLGSGDFSAPVPTEGRDEFAALGEEFNSMSAQLEHRLDELRSERARLRESIRRIGQTFASNLDRPALLELALKTAVDAVQASCGRVTMSSGPGQPLKEMAKVGHLAGFEARIEDAERDALSSSTLGEASHGDQFVASVPLGPEEGELSPRGVITVARRGRPIDEDDREVLRSLAAQATLALENIDLHYQVQRQAVTDELTTLANHRRFQELLATEMDQVRRYHYAVGVIMLDVDDFKNVNDTYGHPQGDIVLAEVARIVRESSRETDTPARYGGEEMAVILPHTDLQGAFAIAERVRTAIAELDIRRIDGPGSLRVTASLGVAASTDGNKDALIAAADAALYVAKRQGKNQTISHVTAATAADIASAE
ncbi:MAG TPA: diguanylate cyclase [Solirubrobacteraceae bacterium]|jgi:diguanylate cyclase (GGDEF)-like protein|nr:diguanylate cyclase [Solirubrobacteraceae bacterium]